jgi:hypothetical protein
MLLEVLFWALSTRSSLFLLQELPSLCFGVAVKQIRRLFLLEKKG